MNNQLRLDKKVDLKVESNKNISEVCNMNKINQNDIPAHLAKEYETFIHNINNIYNHFPSIDHRVIQIGMMFHYSKTHNFGKRNSIMDYDEIELHRLQTLYNNVLAYAEANNIGGENNLGPQLADSILTVTFRYFDLPDFKPFELLDDAIWTIDNTELYDANGNYRGLYKYVYYNRPYSVGHVVKTMLTNYWADQYEKWEKLGILKVAIGKDKMTPEERLERAEKSANAPQYNFNFELFNPEYYAKAAEALRKSAENVAKYQAKSKAITDKVNADRLVLQLTPVIGAKKAVSIVKKLSPEQVEKALQFDFTKATHHEQSVALTTTHIKLTSDKFDIDNDDMDDEEDEAWKSEQLNFFDLSRINKGTPIAMPETRTVKDIADHTTKDEETDTIRYYLSLYQISQLRQNINFRYPIKEFLIRYCERHNYSRPYGHKNGTTIHFDGVEIMSVVAPYKDSEELSEEYRREYTEWFARRTKEEYLQDVADNKVLRSLEAKLEVAFRRWRLDNPDLSARLIIDNDNTVQHLHTTPIDLSDAELSVLRRLDLME